VILAANHTTGLDPLLVQSALPRLVRWVMLRSYEFRVLGPVWRTIEPIVVDQDGGDLAQVREVLRALEGGSVVGLFPEGGAQREHRELQPFRSGIGLLAKRSGAWVVPVWIDGTPQARNMFWHFLSPSRSTVVFGRAYKVDSGLSHEEVVEGLRRRLLGLRDGLRRAENRKICKKE
jgi:1-acyl-sn-glycerol-3-phosphate acyltransferase